MAKAIPAYHENLDQFRAAVEFTVASTGYRAELIEKDYFCSLVLHSFYRQPETSVIFKGGTCLTKVHTGFYRLSEDLDFTLPMSEMAKRKVRRDTIQPFKNHFASIPNEFSVFQVTKPLTGSNESRQYSGELQYTSIVTGQMARVVVEVGLREELLDEVFHGLSQTLLKDPFRNINIIEPFPVKCLTIQEAYAEKLRAALTRITPAIRDFYDMGNAIKHKQISLSDPKLIKLIKRKLSVPGTPAIDLSDRRMEELQRQLESDLFPMLKTKDFDTSDLHETVKTLRIFSNDHLSV